MNCRNFEAIIDDVARGALIDATAREAGLRHAAECEPCGARLSDERALTAGLRSLASLTAEASAPPRVEAALLAAFRERHARAGREEAAPAASVTTPNNVLTPLASHPRAARAWFPRWAQGAAVAAASALLVFGLYAFMRSQSEQQTGVAAGVSPSAPARGEEPTTTAAIVPSVPAAMPSVEELNDDAADEVDAPRQRQSVRNFRNAQRSGRANVVNASYNRGAAAEPEEIATEFIPLMNGGRLPPGDAGHMMRVEVPRSALASFGLPVNADLQGGRVKADVLVGEDGMARAIRFVR